MMKTLLVMAALAASDISFEVENFTAERGISTILLKITNNGSEMASTVFIDCVFMDEDGTGIDIGKALITDLAPGQSKYDRAQIPSTDRVQLAECYVDSVR